MMVKLIIFDWDDVFTLGSKEGYIQCLHDTLIDLGVHLNPEEEHTRILSTWSKPHRDELANLLREKPKLLDRACDMYEEKFFGGTFVNALRFVDDGIDLLQRLKGKYILAVATGAHPKMLKEQVMPKFGVPDIFAQIITGYEIDDTEKQKPHPYMLQEIMRTQNCSPEETVFVGDARSDVQMARSAQVRPIVVLTGHLNREQAEALEVKDILSSVASLEQVI